MPFYPSMSLMPDASFSESELIVMNDFEFSKQNQEVENTSFSQRL